jgi:tetratricopeptide (TPR) repeat protein
VAVLDTTGHLPDDCGMGDGGIDFFISYTAVDERWAEWIAWQLEEASEGWKVKLQKWDIRAGNNFVVEMHAAAAAARHTIAVLSPAYLASRMTAAEWASAFSQDAAGTARRLIPVRIADCQPPGLLASIVYVDLFDKPEGAARAALVAGVKDGRGKPVTAPAFPGAAAPATAARAPAFPGALPPVFTVPYPRNPCFTGRAAALEALSAALAGGGSAAVTQPQAIHGLGGVGKTQLAVEYAYAHAAAYDAVLWAAADSPAVLHSSLAAVAAALELPEREAREEAAQLAAVERWLSAHRRWLLILDNADSGEAAEAVAAVLPKVRAGHVIVTSRRDGWPLGVGDVPVDVLDEAAAVELLLARAPRAGSAEDARAVAAAVGCLPLALEQAAAYVRNRRVRFADYLRDFKAARARVLGLRTEGGTGYKHAVATTWLVTQAHLGSEARAILRLASFLAPAPIPRGLWAGDAGAFRDAVARLDPATAASDGASDPHEAADRGMVELADYSLATLSPDAITFHRLVAAVERDQLAGAERAGWLKLALQLLNTAAVEHPDDVRSWPTWEPLAAHVAEVVAEADAAGISAPTSRLMNDLGLFFKRKERLSEAEALYRRALAIDEATLGPNHHNVAVRLNNLALLLEATGASADAEDLLRRALTIDEAAFGPDHPSVAARLSNLAFLLNDIHRPAEAEPLIRRALAIDEAALGPHHPTVAIRLNNLAGVLWDTNRPAEAEPLFRRALTIDEATLGPNHPNVAIRLSNLAGILRDTDRPDEAEPFFRRSLAIWTRVCDQTGHQHPSASVVRTGYRHLLANLGLDDAAIDERVRSAEEEGRARAQNPGGG